VPSPDQRLHQEFAQALIVFRQQNMRHGPAALTPPINRIMRKR
jgi:hypothetical protein